MTPLDFSAMASATARELTDELDEFIQLYLKLRFGRDLPEQGALNELKIIADKLILRLKKLEDNHPFLV